jgi:hypothetical protein
MWIAVGMLVVCKIRQMRRKSRVQKLFGEPDSIGNKISRRFTLKELRHAARILKIKTQVSDDKKTIIIKIINKVDLDYKAICKACNKAKKTIKKDPATNQG